MKLDLKTSRTLKGSFGMNKPKQRTVKANGMTLREANRSIHMNAQLELKERIFTLFCSFIPLYNSL